MIKINYEKYLKDKYKNDSDYFKNGEIIWDKIKEDYIAKLNSEMFNNKTINIDGFTDKKTIENIFTYYKNNKKSYLYNFEKSYIYNFGKFDDFIFLGNNKMRVPIQNQRKDMSEITFHIITYYNYNFKKLFNYETKFQKLITAFFKEYFNFHTCFYCNESLIRNLKRIKKNKNGTLETVSTFELDHFYEKSKYPYLALSFFNFVPSCHTCNSTIKNSEITKNSDDCYDMNCISPTSKDFNFHNKVKFKIFLSNDNNKLQIEKKNDIELFLKENYSDIYKKYIRVFRLNERYSFHKYKVIEMIEKRRKYPDSMIKELAKNTNQTISEVKKDLFGEYLYFKDEDLGKRPLSKLIKDIAEQLGLI